MEGSWQAGAQRAAWPRSPHCRERGAGGVCCYQSSLLFAAVDQTNQLDKAATRYPWEWMQWESDSRHWNAFDFDSSWNRPLRQVGGVGMGWQRCRVPRQGQSLPKTSAPWPLTVPQSSPRRAPLSPVYPGSQVHS